MNINYNVIIHTFRHEKGANNVKKMHRHIESDDVIDYSSRARKKSIQLQKDEDIEYRNGFLYHSSGNAAIKIKEGQVQDEGQNLISEAFAAQGSYSLDLQQCYVPARHMQSRQRRSISDKMNEDLKEEDLKAHFNMCKINYNLHYTL